MSTTGDILRDIFELQFEHPFSITIGETSHQLQYLIKGGGDLGLVLDKDAAKLAPIADALAELGYASACFDLDSGDFDELAALLDEAGIAHA
jgi:hypothetical protein